jgi:hypothetical protein
MSRFFNSRGYKNEITGNVHDLILSFKLITGRRFCECYPSGYVLLGEASDNAAKFAWGVRGGANLYPGGDKARVGLKLQVGLVSPVQAVGGGLFFGTGGAGAGITTFSTMTQFALGGGLVFRFKQ